MMELGVGLDFSIFWEAQESAQPLELRYYAVKYVKGMAFRVIGVKIVLLHSAAFIVLNANLQITSDFLNEFKNFIFDLQYISNLNRKIQN